MVRDDVFGTHRRRGVGSLRECPSGDDFKRRSHPMSFTGGPLQGANRRLRTIDTDYDSSGSAFVVRSDRVWLAHR